MSENALADGLFHTDGIYVSNPAFERYDQTCFRHYFIFYTDGTVRKGACKRDFNIDEIMAAQPSHGYGKYTVEGRSIRFNVHVPGYDYETSWHGSFEDGNIRFEIDKPDFEDIGGLYTFYKLNSSSNKSMNSQY